MGATAPGPPGMSVVPPEAGTLAATLQDLQADGCPLAPPFDALYRRNPLLLAAIHNKDAAELDLSEVGQPQLWRVFEGVGRVAQPQICHAAAVTHLQPTAWPGLAAWRI